MERLIDPHLLAARKREARAAAPAFPCDRRAGHTACREPRDFGVHVVAHQIEDRPEHRASPVAHPEGSVDGMDGGFLGRKRENQPPAADVHGRKRERVAQKCAIGVRVGAVEEDVRADDHSAATVPDLSLERVLEILEHPDAPLTRERDHQIRAGREPFDAQHGVASREQALGDRMHEFGELRLHRSRRPADRYER